MSLGVSMIRQLKRGLALGVLVAAVSACMDEKSPQPAPPPSGTPSPETVACKMPRPQMCMMIYLPVCGQSQDGSWRTYPNSCQACTHAEVTRYKPGACAT